MREQLIKRLKSLIWRAGGVALIAFLSFLSENAGATGLSEFWVIALGLVTGEITKFLNNQISDIDKP